MKTIKFKVIPTQEQAEKHRELCAVLSHAWNVVRRIALHNRSVEWWKWAEKAAKKDGQWDLEGCTLTAIRLPARNAYSGASCDIAVGGGWWAKGDKGTPIAFRGPKLSAVAAERTKSDKIYWYQGEAYQKLHKFPDKWVDGDRPYERIGCVPFSHIRNPKAVGAAGKEFVRFTQLQNIAHLKDFGVIIPSGTSNFLAGLFNQFDAAYKAWCDSKRRDSHKPRYRDLERGEAIRSLFSPSMKPSKLYGCTAAMLDFEWREDGSFINLGSYFGLVALFGGECDRHPEGMVPRSFSFTRDASGYYISICFATRAEVNVVLTSTQLVRAGKDAAEAERERLKAASEEAKAIAAAESSNPGAGKAIGIDPGVARQLTCHDGEKTFHIKLKRSRQLQNAKIDARIEQLQRKLDRIKQANNKRLGLPANQRRSAGTAKILGKAVALVNEAKLAHKIARLQLKRANRRRAYQHRVAVRLFEGGYSVVRCEKPNLKQMMAAPAPILDAQKSYTKNGAKAKRRLNRSLSDSAMAAQIEKIKVRFTAAGRQFTAIPAPGTTTACHHCQQQCERDRTRRIVRCVNPDCIMHGINQDEDDNAAKNMWRG